MAANAPTTPRAKEGRVLAPAPVSELVAAVVVAWPVLVDEPVLPLPGPLVALPDGAAVDEPVSVVLPRFGG